MKAKKKELRNRSEKNAFLASLNSACLRRPFRGYSVAFRLPTAEQSFEAPSERFSTDINSACPGNYER